jgi:hypothetical protein
MSVFPVISVIVIDRIYYNGLNFTGTGGIFGWWK